MPSKEITSTGDNSLITAAERQILKLRELIVENRAGADATIVVKDVYTRTGETTATERELIRKVVASGGTLQLSNLKGQRIFGTLVINTDQQPLNVTYGVEEV